jgi:hypothetical protein
VKFLEIGVDNGGKIGGPFFEKHPAFFVPINQNINIYFTP